MRLGRAAFTLLSCGDAGVLLEFEDRGSMRQVTRQLRVAAPSAMLDFLPAENTILVLARRGVKLAQLRQALLALAEPAEPAEPTDPHAQTGSPLVLTSLPEIRIPVRYDGDDLAEVARAIGLSPAEVIRQHSSALWRCEFIGFAPGFSYLTCAELDWAVPRRQQSRTAVPAGSVALAGRYSAVYPRSSPGGWHIIGTTETQMWDLSAQPPATVPPEMLVRFLNADDA